MCKITKPQIKVSIYSFFIFVVVLLTFGSKPVLALNPGDICGAYQSGPDECVTSCKRITQVVDGVVIVDYCANGSTGSCQTNDSYCRYSPSTGCLGSGYASLDCASISPESCESARFGASEPKGCLIIGGPTPPPNPCHYVSGDGCYADNCPEWGTGHGKGTNGCKSNEYYCTGGYWAGNCCSVSSWSACSVSCGGGISVNNCGGTAQCNTHLCCVSTTWGACSAACGGGTQVDNCGASRACNTEACNWWQVKDSDVSTNGDLVSKVPTSLYFGLVGDGGFPGVPAFSGATRFTTSNVSTKGWFANTGVTAARGFGSTYFINAIPSDATINAVSESSVDGSYFESGGSSSNGYYWYVYDGATTGTDLSIVSPMSLGSIVV